ncbi:MAG: S1-like domain-containing RNA-binding protein [Verrucomicrobiota bacterium]|nr:S1-like domain-containing RNA-binding protein [Verrucomicrobiota bacterium]
MLKIGEYNTLEIRKFTDFGCYLDSEEETVLLPRKYINGNPEVGDSLTVFVYTDSEDRPIATTLTPYGIVGDLVCLTVKDVSSYGAFLDMGLEKDLLLPFRASKKKLQIGDKCVVKICFDEKSKRMIAVSKISSFLEKTSEDLTEGQKVDLLVYETIEQGFLAIVDNRFSGLLYKNEVFEKLEIGSKKSGYIKKIRIDGKIDLTLYKQGFEYVKEEAPSLMKTLKDAGGFLPYDSKTPPKIIKEKFNMSKKNFKKIIGTLYKQRKIVLVDGGIKIV